MMTLLSALLIGFFGGLRSMTAPAVTAWAAYLDWLKLDAPLSLIGSGWSIAIFTALAIGELIADKLPHTPSRTAPPGLIARIVMGSFSGACIAAAGQHKLFLGALLGAAGGITGSFLGYKARTGLVKTLATRDLNVALVEDLIAVAGSIWVLS